MVFAEKHKLRCGWTAEGKNGGLPRIPLVCSEFTYILMKTHVLASVLPLLAIGTLLRAQTDISTLPDWDGSNGFSTFGEPDTGYFGQTLTVPSDGRLVSYEFRVEQLSGDPTQYQSLVYAWDAVNSRATGPALYTSAAGTFDNVGGGFATVSFTLPGGGLDLVTGQEIVLMFDAVTTGDSTSSSSQFGLVSPGTYAGGEGFLLNSSSGANLPTVASWGSVGGDFAFSARFVFAPEPSTWGAIGLGMAGLVWARMRRR
jgi:hypothetical protein